MIARIQRLILAAQLALAVAVAAWLAMWRDVPWPGAVAIGLLAPIGLHAALLTGDFVLAFAARGSRPPQVARGPWPWLRAWALEIVDSVRTFSIAQPLLAMRPFAVARAPRGLPVLMIHGYFCNRAVWLPLAAELARAGHPLDAVDLEPPFASIDEHAESIAAAVERLRAATGRPRVALLCHSMGGLAARAYLRRHGDDAIAAVVTLGTPHRGTAHASFGLGHCARQMRVDSPWLRELAAGESDARRRKFTVVLSWHDNIVAPQAAQTLEGARTVAFSGIGHVTLAYDRRVRRVVIEALALAEPEGDESPTAARAGREAG